MSFSFYVKNVPAANLSEIMASLPYDDVGALSNVPDSGWPEVAHLYREGVSVRPVETGLEDGTLQVRIFSASAPEDYRLALDVTAEAARRYGQPIESEEGVAATAETLAETYDDAWSSRHSAETLGMVLAMHQREGAENLQLQGVNATMTLGPRMADTLQRANGHTADVFFDRFRRLNFPGGEVYQANIIVIGSEETDKVARLSTVTEGVPTMLSTRARFVALTDPARDEHLHLKLDDFVAIRGEALEWLSEDALVSPACEGAAWAELVETARPLAVENLFADPALLDDQEAKGESGMDAEKVLMAAPIAVFLLVAAADGSIDKKEVAAFQKDLLGSLASGDEAIAALMMACMAQFQEILGGLQQAGPETCVAVLARARHCADQHLGEEAGQRFCQQLNDMAVAIAKASGGGLFGFGSKIGKEEAAALALIERALLGES